MWNVAEIIGMDQRSNTEQVKPYNRMQRQACTIFARHRLDLLWIFVKS